MPRLSAAALEQAAARWSRALAAWPALAGAPGAEVLLDALDDIPDLLGAYRAALAGTDRLRAALEPFLDDEPCVHDHHGACQTHGGTKPCVMVQARAALGLPTEGTPEPEGA